MEPQLVLRAALSSDLNFIRRTWLDGIRAASNGLPDAQWWPAARLYVESKLFSADDKVLIAGASDDPHEILGYAVASKTVLEWIHVRKGLRGRGLAGTILRGLGFSLDNRPLGRWRTQTSRVLQFGYRPSELQK